MKAFPEPRAQAILATAIVEHRAAELLDCLFAGGSATVDRDGRLVLATAEQLAELHVVDIGPPR